MNEVFVADHAEPTPSRDRWRSAMYSRILPGLGQIHNGEVALGVTVLVANVAAFASILALVRVPSVPLMVPCLVFLAVIAFDTLMLIQAWRSARDPGAPPSAWKAAFWSSVYPGVGQLLERRIGIGIVFLLSAFLLSIPAKSGLTQALEVVVGLLALVEAIALSRMRHPDRNEALPPVLLFVLLVVAGLLASVGIRRFLVMPFRMPSESMMPTLMPSDCFFVDRTRAGRADAGDLIALRFPQDRTKSFVKRVVAIGGQTVEIRDKRLLVDGRPLEEPYVRYVDPSVRPAGFDVRDNFGPVRIPAGHVFVLGDNRDNSNDSRYWGTLELRDVLGRVLRIYWPPARAGALAPAGRAGPHA